MKCLAFLVQRKELLTIVFLGALVLTYVGIYFLVEEEFEATAVIIPRAEDDMSGLSSILRGMKGLPLGLGSGGGALSSETDMYTIILESRTLLEKVIHRFDLLEAYDIDTTEFGYMDEALKTLRNRITTQETDESAYLISARGFSRHQAADMTNFLVREMNDMIISLKIGRSRENRIFLENRVGEIREQLKVAEDSMRAFQERTGMLAAKEQVEEILSVHTTMESELAARELQMAILEQQFDRESPQVREIRDQVQAYRKKLAELRATGSPGGPLIGLEKLPRTAVQFLRWYREIEINHLVLEFIIPLYEQAKIEEKKDYPILQVIDYAVPPQKRAWPPRVLLSLLSAFSICIVVFFVLYVRERALQLSDPNVQHLFAELRSWSFRFRRGA